MSRGTLCDRLLQCSQWKQSAIVLVFKSRNKIVAVSVCCFGFVTACFWAVLASLFVSWRLWAVLAIVIAVRLCWKRKHALCTCEVFRIFFKTFFVGFSPMQIVQKCWRILTENHSHNVNSIIAWQTSLPLIGNSTTLKSGSNHPFWYHSRFVAKDKFYEITPYILTIFCSIK